ncbi:hypothetical protein [Mycolicibacterium smegmatis]|uniref:Uncharacterized protein n=1 Tax=Mycolicibacterium smegmatis (strain MKD8) TaxID=1214915 RepID=A0A2U9PJE0_MYCSE|nr:hypothetical protein [Mycolicibacterium smegmatis]AWT51808.1 hypothetical protein D806_008180 [Mycolicibacterium smegmatis MKD8]
MSASARLIARLTTDVTARVKHRIGTKRGIERFSHPETGNEIDSATRLPLGRKRDIGEGYLSIGLNDRTPTGLDYADALLPSPRPSFGAMTGTDSGNIAIFDDTLTDIDRQQLSDKLDAHHPLPELYANIAVGDRNIVRSHSGYGDGALNILLTYDVTGPIAIHIDFGIFDTDEDNEHDDG